MTNVGFKDGIAIVVVEKYLEELTVAANGAVVFVLVNGLDQKPQFCLFSVEENRHCHIHDCGL